MACPLYTVGYTPVYPYRYALIVYSSAGQQFVGKSIRSTVMRIVVFSYFVTISYVIVNGFNRTLDDEV